MIDKNTFDASWMTQGQFFRRARLAINQDLITGAAKRYIDPKTFRLFEADGYHRNCLVCDGNRTRGLFQKNGFPHVQCLDCDFVFVEPVLRPDLLLNYYRECSNTWTEITAADEYKTYQERYSRFHLEQIEKTIQTNNRTLLDVGCNNGEFLRLARKCGWKVVGHEINSMAVASCRANEIEVFDQDFGDRLFGDRRFGAVTFFGVLEHLADPFGVLQIAHKLLEQGGVLVGLVPNIDSLATRILQEKCNTFDGIEHINFWSPKTLAKFYSKAGFQMAHCETTVSEIYTLNNYLHFENPYACPKDFEFLLKELTPQYIHKNLLGHHLLGYARRE